MRFEAYHHDKHLEVLADWLEHYNIGMDIKDFPKLGCVAYDGEKPVAACFLNQMEGASAMIDGLIVDPSVRKEKRNQALNGVVSALIYIARNLHFKRILAYAADVSTLERSKRLGFIKMPHTMMALNLRS